MARSRWPRTRAAAHGFLILYRDFGFDHVVIGLHASIGGVQKPCRRERLNVRVNIAAAGTDVQLELNTAPHVRGVDIIVPKRFIGDVGFEYGEIKPLSRAGRSRFNNQVLNVWDLEGRVQPITYDRNGNIYYGFPGYDEP